jgi:hypothetical protein
MNSILKLSYTRNILRIEFKPISLKRISKYKEFIYKSGSENSGRRTAKMYAKNVWKDGNNVIMWC